MKTILSKVVGNATFDQTKFKLREAQFFLEKMRGHVKRPTTFKFYADAFIASACSVIQALKKEGKQWSRSRFEKIYQERSDKLLGEHYLYLYVRNPSQHEGILPIRGRSLDENYIGTGNELQQIAYTVKTLQGRPICIGACAVAPGTKIKIRISENIELLLPEKILMGDKEEIGNLDLERDLEYNFDSSIIKKKCITGKSRNKSKRKLKQKSDTANEQPYVDKPVLDEFVFYLDAIKSLVEEVIEDAQQMSGI